MDEKFFNSAYVQNGLTGAEVAERIADGRVNGEQTVRTKSIPQILFSNLFTFFNFIFLTLAVILAFFVNFDESGLGNYGFLVLVVFNSVIGIVQEVRAKKTMDKLSLISAPRVGVVRDGEMGDVAVKDVVMDDLTLLVTGDQICADAVVIEGILEVNESLITGEADAITKHPGAEVMSGSCVVSGRAKARVVHIGKDNFAMKISEGAKYFKKPTSVIWRSLMLIVKVMAAVIVPLGIALFCVKYFVQGNDLNNTAVTTIGSLVGMIPSGLAALSSAVFCISVVRLARHKTLAQDMYCIETLARVDVLCLDKTGTITSGTMEVNGVQPRKNLTENAFKELLKNFISASEDENATALALRAYVGEIATTAVAVATVPFSSIRKWSGVTFDKKCFVLGAPEFLFPDQDNVLKETCEMAEKGYRVLALGSATGKLKNMNLPKTLKLEGYVYLTDTIREEAPNTLKFFRDQGVHVKIISGDNPSTVRAVALRAGVVDCDKIIDMSTVKTEAELVAACEKYTVFGRVLPDQKLALVKALKANGHTVAMTGDGVNDVLALKEADCSIAMASGSDAAKNVSSLILLDSNFASMPKAVAEGRRSINNLERSASLFLVKTIYNFILALLFMIIPSELPFAPKQLTLISILTIGVPSFILALEPNGDRITGRFLPKVLASALPGALMVVFGIGAVLLTQTFFLPDLTVAQTQCMYVIITIFVGFVYLFKVCMPFNWNHGILYTCLVLAFVGCYFIELPFFDLRQFFGLTRDITPQSGAAMGVIAAVILPWFYVLFRATNKLRVFVEKVLDRRTTKNRSN